MTREEIIAMAREAGVIATKIDGIERFFTKAYAAGAAAEREECAKVLEGISSAPDMKSYAAAIRARGQKGWVEP